MEISPKGTDTLDDRRFRILTRINEELPYTLPQLRSILKTLCGAGKTIRYDCGQHLYLIVEIGLAAKNNFNDVKIIVGSGGSSNIVVELSQLYNTHTRLRYTHTSLPHTPMIN